MDDVKKKPSFLIRDILGSDEDAAEQLRVRRGDDVTTASSAAAAASAAAAGAFAPPHHSSANGGRRELSTGTSSAAAVAAALLSASALRGSEVGRHQQHQQQVPFDDQWAARVAPELLFLRTFCSQAATNFTSLLAGRFHHIAPLAPPPSALQLHQQQQQQQQQPAFSPLPLQPPLQPQTAPHVAFLPYGRPSDRVTSPLAADETSKSRKCRRSRTVFTESQLLGLEKRFEAQKYLSTPDRVDLASALGLNQLQVKTWYQNRRMKWKKEALQNGELEPPMKIKSRPRQSLSSGTDDECDDDMDTTLAADDLRDVWK